MSAATSKFISLRGAPIYEGTEGYHKLKQIISLILYVQIYCTAICYSSSLRSTLHQLLTSFGILDEIFRMQNNFMCGRVHAEIVKSLFAITKRRWWQTANKITSLTGDNAYFFQLALIFGSFEPLMYSIRNSHEQDSKVRQHWYAC